MASARTDREPDAEWVTVAEAARRLAMSPSWFKEMAKAEGISVGRRGRAPGVRWSEVEALIARSRITRVDHTLLRSVRPDVEPRGVDLMDAVRSRFGWSDHDLADAVGVSWSWLSRWRVQGVPQRHTEALRDLLAADPSTVPASRRLRWSERKARE